MPKEKCWDLLLGTAIWSFCSASSHAQLPKTICVSHSLLRDLRRVFTFTGADMIKIPQTNVWFYFTALECAALGKTPELQLLYTVLHFSEQGLEHGTWPFGSHREGGSPHVLPLSHPGQQNPDPVTHTCDMSRRRLIWWYSTPHLLHVAYNITMRTALKPVLDWALKSASLDWGKIMLCATVYHHHCQIQSKRKHCAMKISLIVTGTETHFYCPSHRTRPTVL